MIKIHGFTLAEVLITLGIIGIVASLTMPVLTGDSRKKEYAARLKKSYSILSQATDAVSNDLNLAPQDWIYSGYYDGDENDSLNRKMLNAYKKHLKVVKEYTDNYHACRIYRAGKNIKERYLNGEGNANAFYSGVNGPFTVSYAFDLADGSTVGLVFQQNKNGGYLWGLSNKNVKLAFIVDVNGLAKPNQIGRDIFWFVLNSKGQVVPYDVNDTSDCTTAGKGYSCAARVINEGEMNY